MAGEPDATIARPIFEHALMTSVQQAPPQLNFTGVPGLPGGDRRAAGAGLAPGGQLPRSSGERGGSR